MSFRDQDEVQNLAEQCQIAVDAPYFDLIARTDLHMTVNRIAFADEIDGEAMRLAEQVARTALQGFGSLQFEVGPLAGSEGALSFSTSSSDQLQQLRARLLEATHTAGFALDVSPAEPFRPHVGIGYCNRTIDAAPIIGQVRALRTLPPVNVCVSELTLVSLTRHERAYSWEVASRLPLTAED